MENNYPNEHRCFPFSVYSRVFAVNKKSIGTAALTLINWSCQKELPALAAYFLYVQAMEDKFNRQGKPPFDGNVKTDTR